MHRSTSLYAGNGHNGSTQDEGKSELAVPIDLRHRAESNFYIIKSPPTSPDDYLPSTLSFDKLPLPLKSLADAFTHVWPVKALGDERI